MDTFSKPIIMRPATKKKVRKNKKQMPGRSMRYESIPPVRDQKIISRVRRCINTASSTFTLTQAQLSGICIGVVASTAILGYYETNVWRLKKVEMWFSTSIAGAGASVDAVSGSLAWPNLPAAGTALVTSVPNSEVDTVNSAAHMGYVCLLPPKDSSFAGKWWSVSSTSDVLVLVCPDQAVIDFHYECYEDHVGARTVYATAIAGATAGTWYAVNTGTLLATVVNNI